jgi:hypothetical protein
MGCRRQCSTGVRELERVVDGWWFGHGVDQRTVTNTARKESKGTATEPCGSPKLKESPADTGHGGKEGTAGGCVQ